MAAARKQCRPTTSQRHPTCPRCSPPTLASTCATARSRRDRWYSSWTCGCRARTISAPAPPLTQPERHHCAGGAKDPHLRLTRAPLVRRGVMSDGETTFFAVFNSAVAKMFRSESNPDGQARLSPAGRTRNTCHLPPTPPTSSPRAATRCRARIASPLPAAWLHAPLPPPPASPHWAGRSLPPEGRALLCCATHRLHDLDDLCRDARRRRDGYGAEREPARRQDRRSRLGQGQGKIDSPTRAHPPPCTPPPSLSSSLSAASLGAL